MLCRQGLGTALVQAPRSHPVPSLPQEHSSPLLEAQPTSYSCKALLGWKNWSPLLSYFFFRFFNGQKELKHPNDGSFMTHVLRLTMVWTGHL